MQARSPLCPKNVSYYQYSLSRGTSPSTHPLALETEAKVIRAEACAAAAHQLKIQGFTPDIICAHPGWGEALFLPDIWSNVPILAYQEFFYHPTGLDTDFDPELQRDQSWLTAAKVRMKNAYLNLTLQSASWNVSPTEFQISTFPADFQSRFSRIHDGIDTTLASPHNSPSPITLEDGTTLNSGDPIVTFVNRRFEPYRGCHSFVRCLPHLQRLVPDVRVIIVGSTEGVSYGSPCPSGEWREHFLDEIDGQYDPSNIHFVGTLAHQYFLPLLRLSACHVYLTYPFVLSWSLLEAMSCGCAVVGSDTAPVQEVIQDGVNGLLVDFFSPSLIADAVAELLRNPVRAAELGHNARRTILNDFSLDVCLPRQLQLINLVSSRSIGL